MLADVSYDEVIAALGYDGSEVWHEGEHLGFPIQEIIDTALDSYGILLTRFDLSPGIEDLDHNNPKRLYTDNYVNQRIGALMLGRRGLATGCFAIDKFHMIAWDGQMFYDPHGRIYSLDDPDCIILESFYMATFRCELQGLLSGIKSYSRFEK